MDIKFQVHHINNSEGKGNSRPYIQLFSSPAKGLDEMASAMGQSSTVTAADIKAVMSEFSHFAINELAAGNRVYIPEVGYLSLSAGVAPTDKVGSKITGKEVYVRNVNFQPEAKFLEKVRGKVSFKKATFSTLSSQYDEGEMWAKIEAYLSEHQHLTRRVMCEQFGLSGYIANKWLTHFVNAGKLSKESFGRQQVYSLA